jgi:hypothetical protein
MIDTLKEVAIDVVIVAFGVLLITAQGAVDRAKGVSCGQAEVTQAAQP